MFQTLAMYSETINRAAIILLAMSFKPSLKSILIEEITAAVELRGGLIDNQWIVIFDLRDVFDEITERAIVLLSVAIRARLPGIADEMDAGFGDRLRALLSSFTPLFHTL